MESHYGAFSATIEYTKSFREERIAQFYFGKDLVNCSSNNSEFKSTLLIQGSEVENRDSRAWLADYFGLPTDFQSRISFKPNIQNVIADLNFYLGLDKWHEGMYFRMHAPIVWTKWHLDMCECIEDEGEFGFAPGYMSSGEIDRNLLATSFTQAINGGYIFGDMTEPIKFGIMTNCRQTKTRLSDVHLVWGWNYTREEDRHCGVNVRLAIPTGNRPCATFLFEPIVGNGKHWELGVGLTSSWIFHRSETSDDRYLGVWMDANFTHMFSANQCRSFDFWCKPNDRYMLLEEMWTNNDNVRETIVPFFTDVTIASYQYQGNLIPAINWSTFNVKVSVALQADIAVKLGYVRDNWSFDLGYNLWARTGERFCLKDTCNDCSCCPTTEGLFAIKGDAFVYGYTEGNGTPIALSATQCKADIHSGKNFLQATEDDPVSSNPAIDNPNIPLSKTNGQAGDHAVLSGTVNNPELALKNKSQEAYISSSFQPKVLSRCDLNMGKSPGAVTHKIFAHGSYAWKDNKHGRWTPFLGFGGEVEFDCCKNCCLDDNCCSPCANNNCITYCDTCPTTCCPCKGCSTGGTSLTGPCCEPTKTKRAGISQWGVWFKGGVAFD